MSHPTNNIAKLRKLRRLSQTELAEKVGAHSITISSLERGKIPLTAEWMGRLAEALHVDEVALLSRERPQKIFVGGELSATKATFWQVEEEGWRHDDRFATAITSTPPITADIPLWVVVDDDSLYPAFQQFDVVRLIPIIETQDDELLWAIGRLCVVFFEETAHGGEKIAVGRIHPGSTVEKLNVAPIAGPPLREITYTRIFVIDRAIYQPEFAEHD